MILAEIADKMLPTSFYFAAALLLGICAATTVTFLRGIPRLTACGIVAGVAAFLAVGLQVDADLVEAARKELGQSYLTISRYWILGSVAVALILALILRVASRSIKPSQNHQAEQVVADQQATGGDSNA